MSEDDRLRWEQRYQSLPPLRADETGLPASFRPFADLMPCSGTALELACGRGTAAVWLAQHGLTVHAYDVSCAAVEAARALAASAGCLQRCHITVADLDGEWRGPIRIRAADLP